MNLKLILRQTQKLVIDHSPAILTTLGVAGVVTTAILTGKATLHATKILGEATYVEDPSDGTLRIEELSNKKIMSLIWREFVPPAVVGVATISMIVCANQIGTRRAAALAAGFKISEQLAEEYRSKVLDSVGVKTEEAIRAKMAQEKIEGTPQATRDAIIISGSGALFFDMFSGRYFQNDMENIRRAVNDINAQINGNYYASLSDFYDRIGLDRIELSDEFGWNADELLALNYVPIMAPEGRPAISIEYNKSPIRKYDRLM